jgi:uncharacterized membrane protein
LCAIATCPLFILVNYSSHFLLALLSELSSLMLVQPIPALIALAVSTHGWRKRSLSPDGALGALIVGYSMLSPPLRTFGVSLILFYFVGSRATKFGKKKKADLEDGHEEAGYRNLRQVLCNSAAAFIASIAWSALYDPHSAASSLLKGHLQPGKPYAPNEWCALESNSWSRALIFATLGQFGCCLGDTLASELGILARSQPRLITTFRVVPPGTNGGVSAWGTFCSVVGGVIMGMAIYSSIMIENAACRQYANDGMLLQLLFWGAFSGGVGSMLDSLLGATVQRTRYSVESKKILQDDSVANSATKNISGLNILTNNQINFVSSVAMALIVGLWA